MFIGAVATLGLIATVFTVNNVFAAQGNGYGFGGMMGNLDNNGYAKMVDAHNLMAQGKYDEARKIMQDLGVNCPMLGGNSNINSNYSNNSRNFGGMMGGYGRGMMGNF